MIEKPDYNTFYHIMEDGIDIKSTFQDKLIIKSYLDKVMKTNKFYCYMISTNPDGSHKQVPLITRQQLHKLQAIFPIKQLCESLIEDKRINIADLYED